MLAPGDRRLLLDALAPPTDYRLDEAVGTTYTLDLLALLRVPLAATALPWADRSGGPVNNPFALLAALRQNAKRVSLFCHAGATSVPSGYVPLLAFLEDAVLPVTPPRGGVFHPKVWLLRFAPVWDEDPVHYRLLVLSRNLTFDRTWDTALVLDGELTGRPSAANRPLSEFIAALPAMATAAGTEVTLEVQERVDRLAAQVRRVAWDLPQGFDELDFHPLGLRAGTKNPVHDLRRLLIIAPFVSGDFLAELAGGVRADIGLIGRFNELIRLQPETLEVFDSVEVFDDGAGLLDADEEERSASPDAPGVELAGLHAKVFVGERGKHAVVFVGSANATGAAFRQNVEFLVELRGLRKQHGIDATRKGLEEAGLLQPFVAGGTPEDDPTSELRRTLQQAAHRLATALVAHVTEHAGVGWRATVELRRPPELGDLSAQLRPLALDQWRNVEVDASPACEFVIPSAVSVSAFFALRVAGHQGGELQVEEVTVRLPLHGAPDGRLEAVTADLLNDRERLLRFILVLLADDVDADGMLDELERILTDRDGGARPPARGTLGDSGLPLLEPLLKALHRDPDRLDEIDRLLSDIERAGGDAGVLIPDDLRHLWATVVALRAGQR